MAEHLPLRSQSGAFWIGAGLVTEALFTLAALLLSQEVKLTLVAFFTSGVLGGMAAIVLLLGSFFLIAWLAHRAGHGD